LKKLIIVGIGIIVCAALCATMWFGSAEVEDRSVESVKAAINAGDVIMQ
jgi:hypothetical protein